MPVRKKQIEDTFDYGGVFMSIVKKIFAALLFTVLCVLAFSALADSTTEDGFVWKVGSSSGGVPTALTITGYTGAGGNITIPAEIDGVPVTRIPSFQKQLKVM